MDIIRCLRCGTDMEFSGRELFRLGEESPYTGVLAVMTSQVMQVDVFRCPNCGKIEFFEPRARKSVFPPKTNWTCSQCGTYNLARVNTCQGCGVTRVWSENHQKKE